MHAPVVGSQGIPGSQCSHPIGFLASLPGTQSQPSHFSVPRQSDVFWHVHTLQGKINVFKSVAIRNQLNSYL